MATKKKLKCKNKKLKQKIAEREEMYETLQDDYHGYVKLYHDMIALLSKFDPELLLKVVRATIRDCNENDLATRLAASELGDTIYVNALHTTDIAAASISQVDVNSSVEEMKL